MKINSSIEQNFTNKIIEERSKRYPELYNLISQFARDLEMMESKSKLRPPINKNSLIKLKIELENLDAKNALFFSTETAYSCAHLRSELYIIIESLNDNALLQSENIDKLRTEVSLLETALKKDMGIMIEEFQLMRNKYPGNDYRHFKE